MKLRLLGIAFILFISLHPVAQATQILPMTAGDLEKSADLVFVGTCLTSTVKSGAQPYTEYTFKVENAVKGSVQNGTTFTLKQWGGGPSQSGVPRLMGMPSYAPGQTYMMYLGSETSDGLRAPIGLGQGVFVVTKSPDGSSIVQNELGNRFLFPAAADSTPANTKGKGMGPARPSNSLRLEDLIQTVRKTGVQP